MVGCFAACLAFAVPDPTYRNIVFVAAGFGADYGVIRRSGAVELDSHWARDVQDDEVTAFDLGFDHMTVLKKDGTVKTVPVSGKVGQAQPGDLRSVVSIGCGGGYSIAMKATGEIVVWGDPYWDVVVAYNARKTEIDGKRFRSFAAGARHLLLLGEDGAVIALGPNSHGECDIPPAGKPIRKLAAGERCSLVLYEDGSVRAFGRNDAGQLDIPAIEGRYVDISAGREHCLAVTDSGQVIGWGRSILYSPSPGEVPAELRGVRFKSVIAKGGKSLALTEGGDLYMWGSLRVRRKLDGD
jgi:alpha-tubulin suppressor-like RCC1 family protein